jgi:hypothetical protein
VSDYCLQGIATALGKCFPHGDKILYLKSSCFDASIRSGTDISLLFDHDEDRRLTKRLQIHAGEKGVAFRYLIPGSWSSSFSEIADDVDTYIPVSIGYKDARKETTTIDGVEITSVIEAKLEEISLLSGAPAVDSTYARVVSLDTCGTLEEDYNAGRLHLIGQYVSLHRAFKASENGGRVEYSHATSPYDRAAARFERALQTLGIK